MVTPWGPVFAGFSSFPPGRFGRCFRVCQFLQGRLRPVAGVGSPAARESPPIRSCVSLGVWVGMGCRSLVPARFSGGRVLPHRRVALVLSAPSTRLAGRLAASRQVAGDLEHRLRQGSPGPTIKLRSERAHSLDAVLVPVRQAHCERGSSSLANSAPAPSLLTMK
jgi:hypothetical protein